MTAALPSTARRLREWVMCLTLTLLLVSGVARAQSHIRLIGRVIDTTGSAVPDAEVRLRWGRFVTRSDSLGRFDFVGVPRALFDVTVRRLGYVELLDSVDTRRVSTRSLEILLRLTPVPSVSQSLPGVRIEDAGVRPALRDFEARRRFGDGHFIDRSALANYRGLPLSQALSHEAGFVRVIGLCSTHVLALGGRGSISLTRAPQSNRLLGCGAPTACYMQVFVDGMRIYAPGAPGLPPNIDLYTADQVEGVEIYRSAAETPMQFGGPRAACGTVLLWLKN